MIKVSEGKKLVYDKLDITIAQNDRSFFQNKQLRKGVCKGVKIIDFSDGTKRANAINVAINDTNGSALVGSTDYRDFIVTGGGYEGSFKGAEFSTNPSLDVSVTSTEDIAATDLKLQMIFAIEVPSGQSN